MANASAHLHVLTGPTAVGKTERALRWAETHDAEIVSCDSLLFYRGLDIGTAKPTKAELARVPHHLIDICSVTERMDVKDYVGRARAAVDDIVGRGRAVLVTGGSGFYLKAFFAPVADDVAVPTEVRAAVEAELTARGLPSLVEELRALNQGDLGELDVANPRRVTRALERCRASGRTLREMQAAWAALPGPFADFTVSCTRLARPMEVLERRIRQRIEQMLRDGLVAEVERARAAGLDQNLSAARAIGYRETLAMLDGALPPAELAEAIAKNTRALVRKQHTWFRSQLPPHEVIELGAD